MTFVDAKICKTKAIPHWEDAKDIKTKIKMIKYISFTRWKINAHDYTFSGKKKSSSQAVEQSISAEEETDSETGADKSMFLL